MAPSFNKDYPTVDLCVMTYLMFSHWKSVWPKLRKNISQSLFYMTLVLQNPSFLLRHHFSQLYIVIGSGNWLKWCINSVTHYTFEIRFGLWVCQSSSYMLSDTTRRSVLHLGEWFVWCEVSDTPEIGSNAPGCSVCFLNVWWCMLWILKGDDHVGLSESFMAVFLNAQNPFIYLCYLC